MLEAALAREAVEVGSLWRQGALPTALDACATVLCCSERGAFLDVTEHK